MCYLEDMKIWYIRHKAQLTYEISKGQCSLGWVTNTLLGEVPSPVQGTFGYH